MQDFDEARFTSEVIRTAQDIQLAEALDGAFGAKTSEGTTGQPLVGGHSPAEVSKALEHSEQVLKRPDVLARLCPALRSASGDLMEVSKLAIPVLLPLALGPQAILSLTPLAFAAVVVVIARCGVKTICPE
jgi:hypothetical protein